MRQLKISLTDDLFRQLAMVSTAAGHSLASEIRRRLERTFAQEGSDPRTDELLTAIRSFAVLVKCEGLDMHGTLMLELTKPFAGLLTCD
jgi:hypothetical protein